MDPLPRAAYPSGPHQQASHDTPSPPHGERHAGPKPDPLHAGQLHPAVSLFARHFRKSPELLEPERTRKYRVHLAAERRLASGSIGVAVAALRFLHRVTLQNDWNIPEILPTPKQPAKLPVAPSPEEAVSFRDAVLILRSRVVLTTCYEAGLRISDIDSLRMVVRSSRARAARTATSCSPSACWRPGATTGAAPGPQATGCSPA